MLFLYTAKRKSVPAGNVSIWHPRPMVAVGWVLAGMEWNRRFNRLDLHDDLLGNRDASACSFFVSAGESQPPSLYSLQTLSSKTSCVF